MLISPPSKAMPLTVGDMIRWLSNFNQDKKVICYCPEASQSYDLFSIRTLQDAPLSDLHIIISRKER